MPFSLTLVSRGSPVVSLAEAMEHCRVTDEGEARLVQRFTTTATEMLEDLTGLALTLNRYQWSGDRWPFLAPDVFPWYARRPAVARQIALRTPLKSVESVRYYDTTGARVTIAPENYRVDTISTPGSVTLKGSFSLPSLEPDFRPDAVTIDFTAGGEISARAKQALLVMVAHLYDNQGVVTASTMNEIPFSFRALVAALRV